MKLDDPNLVAIPAGIVVAVLFVVAVAWVFFPIFIWGQMREVIRLLKAIRDATDRVDSNTHKAGQGRPSSSIKYESGE